MYPSYTPWVGVPLYMPPAVHPEASSPTYGTARMCRFERDINGGRPPCEKGVKEAKMVVSERFMRVT